MECFIIKKIICELEKYSTDRTYTSIGQLEGKLEELDHLP